MIQNNLQIFKLPIKTRQYYHNTKHESSVETRGCLNTVSDPSSVFSRLLESQLTKITNWTILQSLNLETTTSLRYDIYILMDVKTSLIESSIILCKAAISKASSE